MTDDADLDRRLARLFEASRREDPEDHPAPEKLSAYQARELSPEESDAIQEHLVKCAFCSDLLLDLQRFLEPEEEDRAREGVADLGTEAGWRKVRDEMGWRKEPAAAEMSRLKRRLQAFQALAAVLLVGVVGLSMYALRSPELTASLVSSFPSNALLERSGAGEDIETVAVSPGDTIVFTLYGLQKADGECRIEIRDNMARTIWSRSGLRKKGEYLAFPVSSTRLRPGAYKILVTSEGHTVGEFPIKIVKFQ